MYLDTEETIQFCHTTNEPEQVDQSTADAKDAIRREVSSIAWDFKHSNKLQSCRCHLEWYGNWL